MKRKREQMTENDSDIVNRPRKKKRKLKEEEEEKCVVKKEYIEDNDEIYFDEIPKLHLPKVKRVTASLFSILNGCIRIEEDFKNKLDKIKCFFCNEIILCIIITSNNLSKSINELL